MEKTVLFRKFEERDIDFIFKCKNDEKLNSMIVGQYHPFSYEEASQWVRNCMKGDRPDLKFWAICTNDVEKRIVGWISLADIDCVNKKCSTNSIVISDPEYNDGFAWLESVLFMFRYAFEVLELNRVYGVSLMGHKMSNRMGPLMFMQTEGILRQAVFKNGKFYDLHYSGILKDEYFAHKEAGDYEIMKLIRRLRKMRHE